MSGGRSPGSDIKIFFVVPEVSLMPEDYLKSFSQNGFEAYYLDDDPYLHLKAKIQVLFELFEELVLFFNIERRVEGITWPQYIAELHETYKDRVIIGTLYRKRINYTVVKAIEKLYLYDIGIMGGCISLEYQKSKNLPLLTHVLMANQANGRRRQLRALCDESCKVTMIYRASHYHALIRDISISHFSCVFSGDIPDIPMYEKISNMQLSLRGVQCYTDAVLFLKRVVEKDGIHVFIFRNSMDKDGLDLEVQQRVNNFVYSKLSQEMHSLLRRNFDAQRTKRLQGENKLKAGGPKNKNDEL